MGRAEGAVDPVAEVLWGFQDRLSERLDILLQWGTEHACRLPECDLGLARTPLGYKLVATFLSGPPVGEEAAANERGLVVRGQRVLKRGTSHEVQRCALHTARHGVRGGPTYEDGPLRWYPIVLDGSLRMAVPDGELRITPLVAGADVPGAPEAPCLLTFEDARRIYAIELAAGAELQEEGLALWQRQKVRRALQIRLKGKCIDLRSAGLPGVLGYHAVAERTFIVLAWVGGEIGLFYLDGYEFTLLARLEMWDLRHGGPFDVEALMRARANRGVANEGPTVYTEEPAFETPVAEAAAPPAEDPLECSAAPALLDLRGVPDSRPRMADWHRELCERHLKRLRDRLVGRGARKARQLVSLLLEALELCRSDLTGSRREVHVALEASLGKAMPGGDRNIRDCLDLLCRESPLFRKDGNLCAVLFAQLNDIESAVIRRIAELESDVANQPPKPASRATESPVAVPRPKPEVQDASPPSSVGPSSPLPREGGSLSAVSGSLDVVVADPASKPSQEPAERAPYACVPDESVYRVLGLGRPDARPVDAGARAAIGEMPQRTSEERRSEPNGFPSSPHAPISGFTRPWRPLFDDPDDPFDPEMETVGSPSRMYLMSRQKPPNRGDGNQGSS